VSEPNRANVEVWKRRFRRKFAANLSGLQSLADEIAADASESVTFTTTSLEGGNAAGVITGNKMEMLAAAEELISEMDAAGAASAAGSAPLRVIYPRFGPGCFPH
jgi:hypothetical protein